MSIIDTVIYRKYGPATDTVGAIITFDDPIVLAAESLDFDIGVFDAPGGFDNGANNLADFVETVALPEDMTILDAMNYWANVVNNDPGLAGALECKPSMNSDLEVAMNFRATSTFVGDVLVKCIESWTVETFATPAAHKSAPKA